MTIFTLLGWKLFLWHDDLSRVDFFILKSQGCNEIVDGVYLMMQLLMMQLPTDATSEDVERFFQGYNLAGYSTKFLRV
jgi:hypothetical protein